MYTTNAFTGPYEKKCSTPNGSTAPNKLELLSNLVFEALGSCSNLACFGCFNTVFEFNAGDNLGEIVKSA